MEVHRCPLGSKEAAGSNNEMAVMEEKLKAACVQKMKFVFTDTSPLPAVEACSPVFEPSHFPLYQKSLL